MTIVKVASTNPFKAEGIEKAFSHYFKDVQIEAIQIESGVGEQPIEEYVFLGAERRLKNLRIASKNQEYDYLVSCEAGLINQYGQWFNIQVVMIEEKSGKQSMGLSPAYPIPLKYVEEIIETDFSTVLDKLFEGKGGTRVLTKNVVTRVDLVSNATVMALTGLLNGEIW